MDAYPPIVITLLGAISILATAIATMYRERIKAAENEITRLAERNTKLEEANDAERAKVSAIQVKALDDQKELTKYWGSISAVLERQQGRGR